MIDQSTQIYEEKELVREDRDRATGNRSHLGADVCQECGSPDGLYIVRDDPEDLGNWDEPEDPRNWAFTWEHCPECNPGGDGDV